MAAELGPYGRIARFVLDNQRIVAGLFLVLSLVSAVIGLPPKIEPNLLALLPQEEPAVQALQQLDDEGGGANLLTLTFSGDEEELNTVLPALVQVLQGEPTVRYALSDLDETLAQRLGLLQLDPEALEGLSARIQGALVLGPAMNPMVSQRLMSMGPLAEKISQANDPAKLLAQQDGLGRLIIKPTGSSHDPKFATALMDRVDTLTAEALAGHPEVKLLWVGGSYRHSVEDVQGIRSDMLWTSVGSVVLVLALIVFAFHGWRAPVLIFLPLVGANLVNLALVRLFMGSLNTYTSFGTAILVGLGIDFAVHLVGRYRELRASGEGLEAAIVRAWDLTGPPCMTAALTSAAGFLALSAADFRGFSQLGTLLAMGLMLCLGAMLVMLPVLIPLLDARPLALRGTRHSKEKSTSTYNLAPVGLMLAVIATGLFGAIHLPKISWEYDISALRRDGLAYVELDEQERELAKQSYSPVLVSYPTEEALQVAQAHVNQLIASGGLPHFARSLSLLDILPPDQPRRLAALQKLKEQLHHPNVRYLPPPLIEKLLPLKEATLAPLTRADLPEPVLDLLAAGDPKKHRMILFPTGNMWDLRETAKLEAELHKALPAASPAGEYVAQGALFRLLQRDMPIVALLALFLVSVLTAIDLRKPHWVAGALGTLLAGMVWAGSMLEVFNVQLNMINVVGVPILLGIGVDVVIHLQHRLRDEGPGGVRRALSTTGVAATISTLTTVASFASLMMAGNRGVRSLGMLVVIGLITVFLATAILLPTAWAAGWKVSGRAPADSD